MKTFLTIFTFTFILLLPVSALAGNNDDFALGMINEEKLLNNFQGFNENFQQFKLSESEQKMIANWPKTLKVDVYFGTWCHDSEREVPKLLKLLNANKYITATLIALDYKKQDPQQLARLNRVKYTPTIIIYSDESKKVELGRIIERPKKSLIEDINQLLP